LLIFLGLLGLQMLASWELVRWGDSARQTDAWLMLMKIKLFSCTGD
jgi:hypothetical protein